jgi:antitoxin MazE
METTIKKWGNSLGIRLPINITKEMKIEDGSKAEISKKNNKIISSIPEDKIDLDFLITGMNSHDLLDQFEDYPSVGMEIRPQDIAPKALN